ncbi:Chromatin assembly factor 1 subunit rlf2 [Pleurostoma richardsiae]|uniref:Chromatin assembly factor 1 subunit rlf2 n=1 Tax=Pleurostoma richardsiae TaxID=41990 RepID=A0AA38R4R3_9PEZI|nr:Chromatin assembly factor 1 subunit rlf2 [Pleurostoma richardsiae]
MLNTQAPRRQPIDPSLQGVVYTHSRSRTGSSNTFPTQIQSPIPTHLMQPQPSVSHSRRSPSVNTFSTVSSGGMAPPAAYRTSPTNDLRRSTSSRSNSSQQASSYVALLRKQKATVWCDRAQYEDPRLLAQQRAAKMRANLEVVGSGAASYGSGGGGGVRTSTGLSSAGGKVAAKIRHHGKPAVVGYAPGDNYVGVGGVPLRLSATEVEGEDSEEDDLAAQRLHHRRTGSSGRSSTAGSIGRQRGLGYRSSGGTQSRRWSPGDTPERAGSLVEGEQQRSGTGLQSDAASGRAQSTASGSSSAERADNVPDLGNAPRLAANSLAHSTITREKSVKSADDLRRRGSVDERTMTLTAGRLYIANPD